MPHVVAFPSREATRSFSVGTTALSDATVDAAIQQLLEHDREKLIKAANYLEALCANLSRHVLARSHLSVVAEGSSSSSTEAV